MDGPGNLLLKLVDQRLGNREDVIDRGQKRAFVRVGQRCQAANFLERFPIVQEVVGRRIAEALQQFREGQVQRRGIETAADLARRIGEAAEKAAESVHQGRQVRMIHLRRIGMGTVWKNVKRRQQDQVFREGPRGVRRAGGRAAPLRACLKIRDLV